MDEKQHDDVLTSNISSFLAQCWADAIQEHNHGLSKEERSPRWIRLASSDGDTAVITAESLLGSALKAEKVFRSRQGRLAKLSSGVVNLFRRHSQAIDILSQTQPPIGIAVWVPIRMILEIVNDGDDASEIAIEGIHLLVQHLDRWSDLATLFARETRVREALVNLYAHVLDFLQWAAKHLGRSGPGRLCGSILSSKKEKFRRKLDQLKKAEKCLEDEVGCKDKRFSQETLIAIHEMLVRFGGVLEQIAGSEEERRKLNLNRFRGSSSMERFLEYNMDTLKELDSRSQQRLWEFRRMSKWLGKAVLHIDIDAEQHTADKIGGDWLLNRREFSSWLAARNNAVLWLEGKPGCGKTTLSAVLANWLRNNSTTRSNPPQVFFCGFNSSRSLRWSNPSSFAAAFLFQYLETLSIVQPPNGEDWVIATELHKLSNQHPLGPQACPFKKLWSICLQALRTQNAERFLIIDALDECCFDGDVPIPPEVFFTEVLELSQIPQLKLAIFTRPRAAFSRFSSSAVRIPIDSDSVAGDILRYASAAFDALQIRAEYKDEVLRQLASRHEGCFLWVKKCLEYLSRSHNDRAFRDRLYGCPVGLSSLYDQMAQAGGASLSMHDKDWISLRQDLYGLVCVSLLPLPLVDIAKILGIDHVDRDKFIRELGEPFLEVDAGGRVRLFHASVRDYLTTQSHDSCPALTVSPIEYHAQLAVECLKCLLEPQYGMTGRIGQYLHRNLNTAVLAEISDAPSRRISFEYAWQYWEVHLRAVPDPGPDLLQLVQRFLHSFQFAYWSEYSIFRLGGFGLIRTTAQNLNQWYKKLNDQKKSLVTIDDYLVQVYHSLIDAYKRDRRKDEELQWLARMQLGSWLRDIDRPGESADVLAEVVPALTRLFGTTHPLALKARTTAAALYIPQRRYREANHDYSELVRIEEEELGMTDSPKFYATLLGLGHTQLLMNSYAESMETQDRVSRGYQRLNGSNDSSYQSSRLLYAFALVERGELAVAFEVLSGILKQRQDRFGKEDLFSTTAQCAMGDIQRKQNSRTESLANLKAAFALRETLFPLSSPLLMDTAILLLVAYRDFGMRDDARAVIERLYQDGNLDKHFSQACQVAHLRSLLDLDDDQADAAISRLQDLLVQTPRAEYNRPLLWIMLDLAIMLRSRNKPGDKEQAASNFDNILVDLDAEEYVIEVSEQPQQSDTSYEHVIGGGGGDDDDEPDPPRLLRLAEKSLTMVRTREFDKLKALFEAEKLDWRRPDDLWLPFGVPTADTAWMKGPRVENRA